ncbi:MAG TPA: ATP synthase F0 subunit B [Terriglobia bacterium]|nr:ATP synthase F0 subunit B [Terriglobia bacterium]
MRAVRTPGTPSFQTPISGFTRAGAFLTSPDEPGGEDKHQQVYDWINFAILVGALGYLLRKPVAAFFGERSASIRKGLEEGRRALEASRAQLKIVEAKLAHLEQEIASFKASSAQEMALERQRLEQATARDGEKLLASARARIETATRAAKVELRAFAAGQAVELAEGKIRQGLDDTGRERLVAQFVEGVQQQGSRRQDSGSRAS